MKIGVALQVVANNFMSNINTLSYTHYEIQAKADILSHVNYDFTERPFYLVPNCEDKIKEKNN